MSNPRRKFGVGIILMVLFAVVVVVILSGRLRTMPGEIAGVQSKMAAEAVMYLAGVRQTATKEGAVQWELKARSAELEATGGRMTLAEPRIELFLEGGDRVLITAREGILNTKTNDIEVHGHVRVEDSRYTLITEALAYHHDERKLHAPLPVRITGDTMSLSADTMWYDLNTQQALFSGHIHGRLDEKLPL